MGSIYQIYGDDAHDMTLRLLDASNAIARVPSGGSVALNVPGYAENIEDMVKQKALPAVAPHVKVVLSDLDGDNGLIGGAAAVFTETE